MYDIVELNNKLVSELKDIAKELNIPKYEALKNQELIYKILDHQALNPGASKSSAKADDGKSRIKKVKLDNDIPTDAPLFPELENDFPPHKEEAPVIAASVSSIPAATPEVV